MVSTVSIIPSPGRGLVAGVVTLRVVYEVAQVVKIPIVAVLGNHDHESDQVEEVAAILRNAGRRKLGEPARVGDASIVNDQGHVILHEAVA